MSETVAGCGHRPRDTKDCWPQTGSCKRNPRANSPQSQSEVCGPPRVGGLAQLPPGPRPPSLQLSFAAGYTSAPRCPLADTPQFRCHLIQNALQEAPRRPAPPAPTPAVSLLSLGWATTSPGPPPYPLARECPGLVNECAHPPCPRLTRQPTQNPTPLKADLPARVTGGT